MFSLKFLDVIGMKYYGSWMSLMLLIPKRRLSVRQEKNSPKVSVRVYSLLSLGKQERFYSKIKPHWFRQKKQFRQRFRENCRSNANPPPAPHPHGVRGRMWGKNGPQKVERRRRPLLARVGQYCSVKSCREMAGQQLIFSRMKGG